MIVAASTVPVLVLGEFAWLAGLPIALVLAGSFWDVRVRALRAPAVLLAVTYAVPYIIWKTRTDPAPSLSRDIDPLLTAAIVAASAVVIVTFWASRRAARSSRRAS